MYPARNIPFQQLINALLDAEKPLNPRYLYRLSDLEDAEMLELEKSWPKIPARRRQAIMEDIEELGDDPLLSFEALCRYGMRDSDPRVRELAVRTLWEYDVADLIPAFLNMLITDSDPGVRAAVASALGKYVYLGEVDELRPSVLRQIEDRLIDVATGKDVAQVRRCALESLGFSSREEVPALIEKAYYSGDEDWLVSALFAMGRSANEEWAPLLSKMLENESPQVRYEAVRAAGELELSAERPRLIALLNDEDDDVRMAAVWSLSQIGGEGVRSLLEELYDRTDDEDEAEWIESALDNLAFTEDMGFFELMDISGEDEEDEDDIELDDDEDFTA